MPSPHVNMPTLGQRSIQRSLLVILLACSCKAVPDAAPAPESSDGTPATSSPSAPAAPSAPSTPGALAEPTGTQAALMPIPPPAAVTAPVAAAPVLVAASPANVAEQRMLEALARALRGTPFSAIVQHLRVVVVPLTAEEEKHVYQVRVIQGIRGPKLETLSYFLVAEKGEKPSLSKEPVILTLCKNADGFYWPGVGAKFPKTEKTLALVGSLKPELSAPQTAFADCD